MTDVTTRVAAIDCGTNSIRLLVADLPDPTAGSTAPLVDLTRRMEIVRLGQGVDATGRLAPEAIERTRVALTDYAADIAKLGAERVRMCATSATRDAENAADFRAMVEQTLGVPPEVVSGDEEARLSFTGAVRGLPADAQSPYLVVDIGGGSTEFVVGSRDAGVHAAISMDIGCVRMTERHLHGDPPSLDEVAAAQADIAVAVDRALTAVPGREAATLVGLAGSVTTVCLCPLPNGSTCSLPPGCPGAGVSRPISRPKMNRPAGRGTNMSRFSALPNSSGASFASQISSPLR